MDEIRSRRKLENDEGDEKPEATLRKVKHMQNILKREGLSNNTMKEEY